MLQKSKKIILQIILVILACLLQPGLTDDCPYSCDACTSKVFNNFKTIFSKSNSLMLIMS